MHNSINQYKMRYILSIALMSMSYMAVSQDFTLSVSFQNDPTCVNAEDGAFEVIATNGTAPISYELINVVVQDNGTFENLSSGNYTVLAIDADGNQAEITINLIDPLPITLQINTTDPTCIDALDGSLVINEINNLEGVQFSISGPLEASNSTGVFNDLGVGTYVIFASTSSTCQVVISTVVSSDIECEEEEEFSIIVDSQIDPSCNNVSDGSVLIEAINGTAPFEFELDNSTTQDTGLFENLGSGTYTVIATDQNGNQGEVTFSLVSPLPILLDIDLEVPSCVDSLNGSMTISELNNHENLEFSISGPISSNNTSGSFNNLGIGVYTILVSTSPTCQIEVMRELITDIECEENDLCTLTFSKVGIQINKVEEDLFNLIVTFGSQTDMIDGLSYDQLYDIVEFHIANRKIYLTELDTFKLANYCETIEKYRSVNYIQSNPTSFENLDYIEINEISKIQDMLTRIGKYESIKI